MQYNDFIFLHLQDLNEKRPNLLFKQIYTQLQE